MTHLEDKHRQLEELAYDLAVYGLKENIYHEGVIIGSKQVYFEDLMLYLLKTNDCKYKKVKQYDRFSKISR